MRHADLTISLAEAAGDHFLKNTPRWRRRRYKFCPVKAALRCSKTGTFVGALSDQPLDLFAHYERVAACALAADGELDKGNIHRSRAARVYESLGNAPGTFGLSHSFEAVPQRRTNDVDLADADSPDDILGPAVLHDVASVLLHSGRPELLAKELACLLNTLSLVTWVAVVIRANANSVDDESVALTFGAKPTRGEANEQVLSVGISANRSVEYPVCAQSRH